MSLNLFKTTVNDYLEGLPEQVQSRLYESPATCLAIYRLLSPMAKFFIISMLFEDHDISLRDLDKWVKHDSKYQLQHSIKSIKSLNLIMEGETKQPLMIQLNPIFKRSFKNALTGGEINNSFGDVAEDDDIVKTAMLDQYSADKWETILHYMVGTPNTNTPGGKVLDLLQHSGLMEEAESGELKITNQGFQFLLQDVNAQIWTLLLQYLKMSETLQMDPVDVLNFIFMLGALQLGKAYKVEMLSDTQRIMLQDMRDYGLIFQKQSNYQKFYPTRLATLLTSDTKAFRSASVAMDSVLKQSSDNTSTIEGDIVQDEGNNATQDGALIIETNFKLALLIL